MVIRRVEKFDLIHLPLRVIAAKMPVMLHHLGVGMPQPFPDLSFGCGPQKGLAAKVMTKTVKPAMLESNLALRGGELLLERLNDLVDEGLQHVSGVELSAMLGMENVAIAVATKGAEQPGKDRMDRQHSRAAALGGTCRASFPFPPAGAFVRNLDGFPLQVDVAPAEADQLADPHSRVR